MMWLQLTSTLASVAALTHRLLLLNLYLMEGGTPLHKMDASRPWLPSRASILRLTISPTKEAT